MRCTARIYYDPGPSFCVHLPDLWSVLIITRPARPVNPQPKFYAGFAFSQGQYIKKWTLQTVKKVPTGRHVRPVGTPTGKFGAESVRGRKAECAVQHQILSPGGYQGEGISVLRSRQKWVPPGAWRFCDTLMPRPFWARRVPVCPRLAVTPL